MERRSMVDPRNAEVGIPTMKPKKVISKRWILKDNIYTLIDTPDTSPAVTVTLIINISISAPLISTHSQRRAELLVSRPLFVPPDSSNS